MVVVSALSSWSIRLAHILTLMLLTFTNFMVCISLFLQDLQHLLLSINPSLILPSCTLTVSRGPAGAHL